MSERSKKGKVGVRERIENSQIQKRQTVLRPVHTCLKILQAAFQETQGVSRREQIEIFHNSRFPLVTLSDS